MSADVGSVCTLMTDLSAVPRSEFTKLTTSKGVEYLNLDFSLDFIVDSASLMFELKVGGVSLSFFFFFSFLFFWSGEMCVLIGIWIGCVWVGDSDVSLVRGWRTADGVLAGWLHWIYRNIINLKTGVFAII